MSTWCLIAWLSWFGLASPVATLAPVNHFRITADFTVKQKQGDKGQMVSGKLYYDLKVNKLCYQIQFPEPEYLVFKDSLLFRFNEKKEFEEVKEVMYHPALSTYALVLTRSLEDLGLKRSGYGITDLQMKGDSVVITRWDPPPQLKDKLGRVFLSHQQKIIQGAVFYNPRGDLIAKEFYQEMEVIDGMPVPTQKLTILYPDGEKRMTITKLKNVRFDELDQPDLYNFPLPD
jgi:hypothetical protein